MSEQQPQVKPGVYEHYKGRHYQVITTALHTDEKAPLVIYVALYYDAQAPAHIWARPLDEFLAAVNVNGSIVPRFRYLRA